ncbi:MAG: hypothetical protein ACR2K1_08820 [Saprospiraceae bacterium]
MLLLAGATLAVVGGYNNALFWALVMSPVSREAQIAFVIVSIACGAIKILVPAFASANNIGLRDTPRAALIAFAVAILFDVASGLGYAGLTRAAATADQREANRRYEAAKTALDDARTVLLDLQKPARTAERIKADLAAREAEAGGPCEGRRGGVTACAPVHKLRGELADAVAHANARDHVAGAELAFARVPAPRDPDPQLAAIGKALEMFGAKIRRERLEAAWGLLMLLLLEFGAFPLIAFALAPGLPSPGERPREPTADRGKPLPPPQPVTPEQTALLAILRGYTPDADGWVSAPLAALETASGRSVTTVSRDLAALVAAGKLAKRSAGRGFKLMVLG